MALRPYQQDCTNIMVSNMLGHRPPQVYVLSSGAGKSHIIAAAAKAINDHILILQPSKEILEQNFSKYIAYGFHASIYSASFNSKNISKVCFATIGSIKDYDSFKHFRYVIVDEMDLVPVNKPNSMYMKLFKAIKPVGISGLTATPYRVVNEWFEGKDQYGRSNPYIAGTVKMITDIKPYFFTGIAYKIELWELQEMGYLARTKYFTNPVKTPLLKRNSTGTNYTEDSINKDTLSRSDKIINAITYSLKTHKKTMVFLPSVPACIRIQLMLLEKGISVGVVHALTPANQRTETIKQYRSNKISVLLNMGVFLVGFDDPQIDSIIWDRSTLNPRIFYQGIGRGLRIDPNNKDKILHVYDISNTLSKIGAVENLRLAIPKNELKYQLYCKPFGRNVRRMSNTVLYYFNL